MKNCLGCSFAVWDKTKTGKLHPSGHGVCAYKYKIPPLPGCKYWINAPCPCGGSISRKEELENHCVYYQK
jgi:hypothetical protein